MFFVFYFILLRFYVGINLRLLCFIFIFFILLMFFNGRLKVLMLKENYDLVIKKINRVYFSEEICEYRWV